MKRILFLILINVLVLSIGCDSIKERHAFHAALIKDGEMYIEWHQDYNNQTVSLYYKFKDGQVVEYKTNANSFDNVYLLTHSQDYRLRIIESSSFDLVFRTIDLYPDDGVTIYDSGSIKKKFNNTMTVNIKDIELYSGGEEEFSVDITIKQCVASKNDINKREMSSAKFNGKAYIYIPNYKGSKAILNEENNTVNKDQESITEEEILQSEAAGGM